MNNVSKTIPINSTSLNNKSKHVQTLKKINIKNQQINSLYNRIKKEQNKNQRYQNIINEYKNLIEKHEDESYNDLVKIDNLK